MNFLLYFGLLAAFICVIKGLHSDGSKKWYEEGEEADENGMWGDMFNWGNDSVRKPNILIKTVIYKLEEDGQSMGEIKLMLNKENAPFTSDDFIKAMKELKENLDKKDEEVDITDLYPQFKHDWSVHNYEKCPEDRVKFNSLSWLQWLSSMWSHEDSSKVEKHNTEEMDDEDAYRMFPWLGEDTQNYGHGTIFLQKKGTLVIAIAGNEKVCGTAVGKVADSTMQTLEELIEKVQEQDGITRHKRGTGFGIWDISLK